MINELSIYLSMEIWGCFFCLIFAGYVLLGKEPEDRESVTMTAFLISMTVLLGADVFAWMFRGGTGPVAWTGVRVSNFLVFLCSYICLGFSAALIMRFAGREPGKDLLFAGVEAVAITGALCSVLNLFLPVFYRIGEDNIYRRDEYFWLSQVLGIIGLFLMAALLYRHRNSVRKGFFISMAIYIAAPLAALFLSLRHYGISYTNIAFILSIMFSFIEHMYYQTVRSLRRRESLLVRERELEDMRIRIVLSQIHPHFIFNVLNTIYYLCGKDVKEAQEAISTFSEYLRANMTALRQEELVPVSREMSLVEKYLWLEKLRFEEDLNIEYDMRAENFFLPTLSIQPIVENAVKHGVGVKLGGGTVRIASLEEADAFVVTVSDDGAGFDPGKNLSDGREHVGIRNVRERVQKLCGGSLSITSREGEGTTAVIRIPKQERLLP